jgi:hypothetical protein
LGGLWCDPEKNRPMQVKTNDPLLIELVQRGSRSSGLFLAHDQASDFGSGPRFPAPLFDPAPCFTLALVRDHGLRWKAHPRIKTALSSLRVL